MNTITEKEAIEIASDLLNTNAVLLDCRELDDKSGFYICERSRGGKAIIVANDNSVLFANSSIGYEEHLAAFRIGKRNDRSEFI